MNSCLGTTRPERHRLGAYDAFHAPTIVSTSTLVTAPVIDAETFHTGAVGAASALSPALVSDTDTVYAPGPSRTLAPQLVTALNSLAHTGRDCT